MNKLILPAVALAALAWAASSWAQTIYKSTMPDGRVIYGTEPARGAKRVETMKPPPDSTGVQPVAPQDTQKLEQRTMQRERQEQRQDEVQQAEKALRDAEAAQAAGKEPLPGERMGTAGGGSRLTDEYWDRQKSLEAAVAEARKRLDELRGPAR
ncbi:MAG TPA: DUF4124 domain-containing protein [Burkholderiales bacterium]|nr:DUF4124 domain-containing protein [Burkholderiales bacterium]